MPTILSRSALALLLAPVLLGAQTADTLAAKPIPLRDAVALAQQNAVAAVQARGQIRSSESGVRAARAALLPSLNFTMGQVNQSGDRFDNQGRLVPYLAPQPDHVRGQLVGRSRGATAAARRAGEGDRGQDQGCHPDQERHHEQQQEQGLVHIAADSRRLVRLRCGGARARRPRRGTHGRTCRRG